MSEEISREEIAALLASGSEEMTKEETLKEFNDINQTCHGCIYEDLSAVSYPCLSCKRICESQSSDFYKDEEE